MTGGETLEHHRGGEMLVRARLKDLEHLPEWLNCCSEVLDKFKSLKRREFVVDLGKLMARDSRCPCCRASYKHSIAGSHVYKQGSEWHCAVSLLDLDEGLIEDSHA